MVNEQIHFEELERITRIIRLMTAITEKGVEELERIAKKYFEPCPQCGRSLHHRLQEPKDFYDEIKVKCSICDYEYIRKKKEEE